MKTCCFIGHRKINETEELEKRLKSVIIHLIENEKVEVFLFGSRSDFNSICHAIVTELKEKYPHIQRRAYTCRNETCVIEKERKFWEGVYSSFYKEPVSLLGVEEEIEHKTKWSSGKAQYVERNQAMINDSDYCIFYYDENYQPEMRKYSKRSIGYYQPKSGTSLAYAYAKQKKKQIINIKEIIV